MLFCFHKGPLILKSDAPLVLLFHLANGLTSLMATFILHQGMNLKKNRWVGILDRGQYRGLSDAFASAIAGSSTKVCNDVAYASAVYTLSVVSLARLSLAFSKQGS